MSKPPDNKTRVSRKKIGKAPANETKTIPRKHQKKSTKTAVSNSPKISKRKSKVSKPVFDEITLPDSASSESLKRISLIEEFLFGDLARPFYKITYVTGLCLLLIGLTLVASDRYKTAQTNSVAQMISSTNQDPTDAQPSEFSFDNDVPANITDPFLVKFTATNAREVNARLEKSGTTEYSPLSINDKGLGNFELLIDPGRVPVGYYKLKITVSPQDGGSNYTKSTNEFHIGPEEVPNPTYRLISVFPHNIFQDQEIEIEVTNADNVETFVIDEIGTKKTISSGQISNNRYNLLVRPDQLEKRYYDLKINIRPANNTEIISKIVGHFFAGTPNEEDIYNNPVDSSTTDNTNTTNNTSATDTINTGSSNSSDNTNSTDSTQVSSETTDFSTGTTTNSTEPTIVYKLTTRESTLSGTSTLITENAEKFDFVELYYRPEGTLKGEFVALARMVAGAWRFVFDSKKIPNGEYEFFAKTKYSGSIIFSKPLKLKVENSPVSTTSETEPVNTTDSNITQSDSTPENNSSSDDSTDNTETPMPKFHLEPTSGKTLSGSATIVTNAPIDWPFVELYARPLHSLTKKFVTLANKRQDKWAFAINTINFPNGDYELVAESKVGDKRVSSESLIIKVYNSPQITTSTTSTPKPQPATTTTTTETREFVTVENTDNSSSGGGTTPTKDKVVVEATDSLLHENADDLNALLERYAVARQASSSLVAEEAKLKLESKFRELARNSTLDPDTQASASEIEQALEEKLLDLKQRVDTFETLRAGKMSASDTIDSDNDGISDFDERVLYKTDPYLADSDNDGIIDGVEIVGGYDPNNASPETDLVYEYPKETVSLVRADVLTVSEVSKVDEEQGEVIRTSSEIVGKALPNSFATLYIYSTPTVVTVKTDPDGSFRYTFEKELEDGTHEVYVAITDNEGDIIARSNPFTFVKTAEAYTPVDAHNAQVVTSDISNETRVEYSAVVSVGILALGLILLMLGISIRTKEEERFIA